MGKKQIKIQIKKLGFYYKNQQIFENICIEFEKKSITSISGPSGQGKSSFLMALNRLWESIEDAKVKGTILMDFGNGFEDIYHKNYSVTELRQRVGMVFQVPNPLPMSIYKNIEFPLKLRGEKNKTIIAQKIEQALTESFLWDEVKDRLSSDAGLLSGGQQQRLCIARALVLEPQVLLLDEPTSSLDETSARVIEDLLVQLKKKCTIILVSHHIDQVDRIADNKLVLSDRRLEQK
ncbi:MAG: phosphate ABC transporter ATP-binding protein [Desulfobacteraceae bacterium 4572_89]|nr:MAG: phosphate ABC transporter ATP-binding protein [Desulfobacteraceae bacterium 4572_89]